MDSFTDYVHALGDMHDCRVLKMEIDLVTSSINLQFDDLYGNFKGLPDYPGLTPAMFHLDQIELLSADFSRAISGVCGIYEFRVEKETEEGIAADISFWPSGKIRILFRTARVVSGETAIWPLVNL